MLRQQPNLTSGVVDRDEEQKTLLDLLDLADRWKPDQLDNTDIQQPNADQLKIEVQRLQQEIVVLRSSISWRVTAPMRLAGHWLGTTVPRWKRSLR